MFWVKLWWSLSFDLDPWNILGKGMWFQSWQVLVTLLKSRFSNGSHPPKSMILSSTRNCDEKTIITSSASEKYEWWPFLSSLWTKISACRDQFSADPQNSAKFRGCNNFWKSAWPMSLVSQFLKRWKKSTDTVIDYNTSPGLPSTICTS